MDARTYVELKAEVQVALVDRDDGSGQSKLFRQHFYWRPFLYKKPPELEISEEEALEEAEIRRMFPELGPPCFEIGHWLPKPDAPLKPSKKRSAEAAAGVFVKKQRKNDDQLSAKLNQLNGSTLSRCPRDPQLLVPAKEMTFIKDPVERVMQCINVLCGNNGVCVDRFITKYICENGLDFIK